MVQYFWICLLQIIYFMGQTNSKISFRKDPVQTFAINDPLQYAKNPRDTMELANLEVGIARKLAPIFLTLAEARKTHQRRCQESLLKYLSDYERDNKLITENLTVPRDVTIVADNPLLTMRMIRRIVYTLIDETLSSCGGIAPEIKEVIDFEFRSNNMNIPTREDLNEVLEGVLFLQFIYDFNALHQLRFGNFKEINSKVHLNFDDCVALTKTAFEKSWKVLAHQWLESAKLTALNSNRVAPKESKIIEQLGLQNAAKKGRVTFNDIHVNEGEERQPLVSDFVSLHGIDSLCRGENIQTIREAEELTCILDYNHAPYFAINPLKKEIVSKDPFIVQYYDFATEKEIQNIETFETNKLQELYEPENEVLKNLRKKIELLTGLVVNQEDAGYFQKTLYTPLGLFTQMEKSYIEDIERSKFATLTIQLNEVRKGGNIVFDKIKRFAQPTKGSVLFWRNFDSRGATDMRLHHKHCPVVLGNKQTAVYPLDVPSESIVKCDSVKFQSSQIPTRPDAGTCTH